MNGDRDALKQQVKEANDIVGVVGSYISLRPKGPTFMGLCPFHEDSRPSFDVDPRRQRYRCWACGKHGDVFNFVQEHEKVSFPEALELLARRAGISLENFQKNPPGPSRTGMLDVMKWAAEQFQSCLLDSPQAEVARDYLGERKLSLETIRNFGLGYAPESWEWLVANAANAQKPADLLETVGLIAKRNEGRGYYDRFRDRVMFPIRDLQGRIVGFGGRILPSSSLSDRGPKYYNSSETPLFSKSDQLYGIDQARQAASKAGYLAVVEGYTDVLMAHQHGVSQVVATMGTALNARHIKKLRGIVSRVVLVFDADAGGKGGVDRALEVFVKSDLDLRIATLPEGLDPCDLIAGQGPEPFRLALEEAIDVFEYKLQAAWAKHAAGGLEGRRLAAEEMLGVLALTPDERSVKLELMVNRIAQRLLIKEETVWSRLKELRKKNEPGPRMNAAIPGDAALEEPLPERSAPAAPHERELVELLLAEPALIARSVIEIPFAEVEHPGLRHVIETLYRLHALGQTTDLDHLREPLNNERLWDRLFDFQLRGLDYPDRPDVFQKVLARFRERRLLRRKQALKNQLQEAADPETKSQLMRQYRDLENSEAKMRGDTDGAA
ncbi:MAG: DNA primase [Planctomycetes bacterium]|nr:DNA primase [Planctomycetota bacterium]